MTRENVEFWRAAWQAGDMERYQFFVMVAGNAGFFYGMDDADTLLFVAKLETTGAVELLERFEFDRASCERYLAVCAEMVEAAAQLAQIEGSESEATGSETA